MLFSIFKDKFVPTSTMYVATDPGVLNVNLSWCQSQRSMYVNAMFAAVQALCKILWILICYKVMMVVLRKNSLSGPAVFCSVM